MRVENLKETANVRISVCRDSEEARVGRATTCVVIRRSFRSVREETQSVLCDHYVHAEAWRWCRAFAIHASECADGVWSAENQARGDSLLIESADGLRASGPAMAPAK